MDKLRRSIRQSFRRKNSKDFLDDTNKPHQWQKDEAAVRSGTCSFSVKYLGCVEVFESRGMQVCEEALKVLRNSRRKTVRGFLYISGDGLRVVDADNKGLIVDQTIEKVSFCAPDRNNEKGFAYICRDGTTRRWMCHGFSASKDSGERLSHAVGCAFAVCLEHKQKRDREASSQVMAPITTSAEEKSTPKRITPTVEHSNSYVEPTSNPGFSATNPLQLSFRRASLAERKQDPQNVIPAAVDAIWEGEEDSLNDTVDMPSSSSNQYDRVTHKNSSNGMTSSFERQRSTPLYKQNCSSNMAPGLSGENISSQDKLSKSKGDEWLQIAASQAKLLKQLRETPPMVVAGGVGVYGASPVPATTGGSDGALPNPSSSSHSNNNFSTPPLPIASSSYFNDGQVSASSNEAESPATSSTYSPVKNSRTQAVTIANSRKQSTAADHLMNWRSPSSFDAAATVTTNFGFSNSNSSNFDDKWNSLNNAVARIHNGNNKGGSNLPISSTNPFKQESSAVHI